MNGRKHTYYANRKPKRRLQWLCEYRFQNVVELVFPKRYIEVLTTPGASECDLIWK